MFDLIRNHRRWMQFILLILIVPAFAFFGLEGYMSFMSDEKELAVVNDRSITLPEFDQARRAQLESMRMQLGPQFDAQAIDTPAFRENLLNQMIDQRVLVAAAMAGRYSVSNEMLRQTIADVPVLQVDGQFSPDRYREVLAAQGMTPDDFEQQLRSDMILSQVLTPIGSTAQIPTVVMDGILNALTEQRNVATRRFLADAYLDQVDLSEADLKAWYDSHAKSLEVPDSVSIEYVVLDEDAATQGVTVTDDQIQSFYGQNQSRYGQAERRRVSHILFDVPPGASDEARQEAKANAEQALTDVRAQPDAFADIAKERSKDPGSASQGGDLGWIGKDTLVPEVENAVFALDENAISDIIESPFGYHLILVTGIQPASVKPLEQVRDDIESQIKMQLASARFADLSNQLTAMVYDQPEALEPIAQQLGLTLQKADGLSRDGVLSDALMHREVPMTADVSALLEHPRVRQTAFSEEVLKSGQNSGAIELSADTMIALRVTDLKPAHIPSFDIVQDLIRDTLTQERALKLAREEGEKAYEAIKAGGEALGFRSAQVVSRVSAMDMSEVELSAALAVPQDEVPSVVGVETSNGYSLVDVLAIEPNLQIESSERAQLQAQFSQALGQAEEASAMQILRQQFGAKITPEGRAVIESNDND
ncbi:SurA N-terminal domain-containing protein [Orrella sp. 11846]|uniref:SurA N-terminal domain-containing protein n=1 Tax=Orrella sp. 11846 TaxID=3409913 RepID=UPI003B590D5F